jgi:hypothetical protein
MCDFNDIDIETVYANKKIALAVTEGLRLIDGRKFQLGITLKKESLGWIVKDLDWLPKGEEKKFLKKFVETFPDAKVISKRKTDVQVEAEEATLEEFRKKAWKVFGLPPGVMDYLDSCVKDREEMNPEKLITVRCVDNEGKGISYCRVVFVDRGEQIRLIDYVATDEKGYAYCDDIDGPFSIMAQVFDYSPLTKAWRFQHKKIEKLYNANDKPVITVQWPIFPEGIGQIQGNVKDQYEHPLKEFDLVLTQREGENEGWGDCFTKQIKKHFIHPEGNFEIGNLTAGTYTYFMHPKENSAYVWDFNMGEVTVGAEDTVQLNIEIEAKNPAVQVEGEVEFELITRPLTKKGIELQLSRVATLQYWNEVFDLDSEMISHYEPGAWRWPKGADVGFDIDFPQEIRGSVNWGINIGYETTGHRFLALDSYSFEQAVWETSTKLDELRNSKWMGFGLSKLTLTKFPEFFAVLTDGYSVKADSTVEHPSPKLAIIEVVETKDKSAEIKYWLERKTQNKPVVQAEAEGIKTEIQKLVNGFWTAVIAKDWQAVKE